MEGFVLKVSPPMLVRRPQMINRTLLQKQLQQPQRSLRRRAPPRNASSGLIDPRTPLQIGSSRACEGRLEIMSEAQVALASPFTNVAAAAAGHPKAISPGSGELSRFGRTTHGWTSGGGGSERSGMTSSVPLFAHSVHGSLDLPGPATRERNAQSLRKSVNPSNPLEGVCGAVGAMLVES